MFPRAWARAVCLAPLVLALTPLQTVDAATPASSAPAGSTLAANMKSAAQARHVPLAVIEAIAYVNTRWEWITTLQHNGGVGPMDVRPSQTGLASRLSGHTEAEIATDLAANLDAGAALLTYDHTSGTDLVSWQPAVTATQGSFVAAQIYDVMRTGATRTTSTGETITLAPQTVSNTASSSAVTTTTTTCTASPDYGSPACWVPADPSNYSLANRGHDYAIDMIVIHDIEGSYGSAIQDFQQPNYAASAHYVVSYGGAVTQMVREKDIAWHAGNWDYNTRSIGIEHEGFAAQNLYTTAEYNASASIAASICSRYGVQLDRTHVIGHSEVPDPNNPGLFGGVDHHTDPGRYWNWTYYMAQAQADAKLLPSPPHVSPDPLAVNGTTSVTVSWTPARTCRPADAPITGYTITGQPGNLSMDVPAAATNATFTGLQPGTSYTFTVTAHDSYGDGSATSNAAIPGRCNNVGVAASPASPQSSGTQVTVTASSGGCVNPTYEFWILYPGASLYILAQPYSASPTLSWNTAGLTAGTYQLDIWARDAGSPGTYSNPWGTWDDYDANSSYSLRAIPCNTVSQSATPASPVKAGMPVTVTAAASGCPNPRYEFWVLAPGASLYKLVQAYSPSPTLSWNTGGMAPGTYRINVWVRDASSAGVGSNASGSWDAYNADLYYGLTAGCPSVAQSAAPAGGAMIGTTVTVTASAPGCPNPQYEFWALYPGASLYTLVQPYSGNPTLTWNTAGRGPGTYRLNVWIRDGGGPGVYSNTSGSWDAYNATLYYALTGGCPSVSVTVSPSSAPSGTSVNIAASAPGCPNPQYEFWILYPGATLYKLIQPYSAYGTLSWNTTGLARGAYRVNVWVRDGGSPGTAGNSWGTWDAYNASAYVYLS